MLSLTFKSTAVQWVTDAWSHELASDRDVAFSGKPRFQTAKQSRRTVNPPLNQGVTLSRRMSVHGLQMTDSTTKICDYLIHMPDLIVLDRNDRYINPLQTQPSKSSVINSHPLKVSIRYLIKLLFPEDV